MPFSVDARTCALADGKPISKQTAATAITKNLFTLALLVDEIILAVLPAPRISGVSDENRGIGNTSRTEYSTIAFDLGRRPYRL